MIPLPSISILIIPINTMKLIALSPIKLHKRLVNFLKLFVHFDDQDLLSRYTKLDFHYNEDYKQRRTFAAKNSQFSFISIYNRVRGFRFLLRIIANVLFFSLSSFLERKIKEIKIKIDNTAPDIINQDKLDLDLPKKVEKINRKLKITHTILKYLTNAQVSFNSSNFLINILYMWTSIKSKIGVIDYLVISADLMLMIFFQYLVLVKYLLHKGKATKSIKNLADGYTISSVFPYQKGECLQQSIFLKTNFIGLIQILIYSLFQTSSLLVGIFSIIFNTIVSTHFAISIFKDKNYYIKWTFLLLCFTKLNESLVFILIGIVGLNDQKMRNNDSLSSTISASIMIWIIGLVIFTFVSIIKDNHSDIFLLEIFTKKKDENKTNKITPVGMQPVIYSTLTMKQQAREHFKRLNLNLKYDQDEKSDNIFAENNKLDTNDKKEDILTPDTDVNYKKVKISTLDQKLKSMGIKKQRSRINLNLQMKEETTFNKQEDFSDEENEKHQQQLNTNSRRK